VLTGFIGASESAGSPVVANAFGPPPYFETVIRKLFDRPADNDD